MNKDTLSNAIKKWQIDWTHPGLVLKRDKSSFRSMRFHTLPDSKRYPENNQELAEILNRHHKLLSGLGGEKASLLVVLSDWTHSPEANSNAWVRYTGLAERIEYWQTILQNPEEADPDFKSYRHLYCISLVLTDDETNDILRRVANDELSGVVITSTDSAWLYHPYDGGADVILSPFQQEKLVAHHREWVAD